MRNKHIVSTMRTAVKKVEKAVQAKKPDQAVEMLKKAIPVLDKAASKGVIHKNKAARHVSRLTRKVNALRTAA
jgi:small subunit ribosomal protein S20